MRHENTNGHLHARVDSVFTARANYLEHNLRPAEARFNSSTRGGALGCLEGTRVDILRKISQWIFSTDVNSLQFFWLYGMPGEGKSTIAQTISEYCAAAGNLGGSFFFSQNQAERADGRRVLSTIAYQLAYSIPSFQARLLEAVKADPEARSSDLRTQLRKLIVEPLQDVVDAPCPIIIVLDAVDECENPAQAKEILTLLAETASHLPPYLRLRILVTSRPEAHLHPPVLRSTSQAAWTVFDLHKN